MRGTSEYEIWCGIWKRCTNPNNRAYSRYGGRGIQVCARWKDFTAFYADMGPRPEGSQIERVENDGNYEPSNCVWATRSEQMRNTRRSHKIVEGQKFGKLVAIREAGSSKDKRQQWEFLCDCGQSYTGRIDRVIRGRVKSCGCFRSENTTIMNKKRGRKL